jgi:ATP-binding cassette subfamily B protein
LLSHPAFAGLGAAGKALLEQAATPVRFGLGQPLASGAAIPNRVIWITTGQARCLFQDRGEWQTLCTATPGSLVGLASVLRAAACEEVSARSAIEGLAIPDQVVVQLLQQESSFRHWCATNLFEVELAALIAQLISQQAIPMDLKGAVALLAPQALLLEPADLANASSGANSGANERVILAASANLIQADLGEPIDATSAVEARPPLAARLISLPADWAAQLGSLKASDGNPAAAAAPAESSALVPAPTEAIVPLEGSKLDLGQGETSPTVRLIRANGALEETLACFQMLAQELRLPFRRDAIDKILRDALRRNQNPDLQLLGNIAALMGLHVSGMRVPADAGGRLQTPALLLWQGGPAVLRASDQQGMVLASPRDGWVELNLEQVAEHYPDDIELLLLERTNTSPEQRFDFTWFWPALQRHRGVLIQVLLASFVVQLFSLANPLLIQVIIDKVIAQRSLDTLQVLGLALVVVTLMEGVIGALRTFLFTETTNRIDLRLGAEVIDHLLRLPLGYFDKRPVGELGTRIAELEKIRNFLTGQALTTVLDAAFSVIYVLVMLLYSWLLTLIALAVLPIQVGLTVVGAPLFRRQYRQAAEENARTQSHLVEVLSGIQTVKAQNVEMVSRWKWQDYYSRYISRSFEKTITGTAVTETSQVLQKLSQLLVLWVGASLVLKGEMSLGQLIAFRIISGYVTQPLLRLSSIWQNIQELKVSFERLADVVDTPQESNEADKAKIPLPPLDGEVEFRDVCFRFSSSSPQVLNHINLTIPTGTFVGVVGQSGSGKSTLTKMLPRLYAPDQGQILIDGYDIDKVELYSLRRQIGIVPQEPLLFSGSIAENIALTDPDASSDAIVQAARLACAHDFIMELPGGYSANVGERGGNLSGGQRQRIALARTLLSAPRLLVLDEATSALDYATERRVCDNLLDNLHNCTVFFITHRLSTIRRAKLIVMLDQGQVVETGTHDELIERRGRYFALFRQQEAS